jgi:hypothetical protein
VSKRRSHYPAVTFCICYTPYRPAQRVGSTTPRQLIPDCNCHVVAGFVSVRWFGAPFMIKIFLEKNVAGNRMSE